MGAQVSYHAIRHDSQTLSDPAQFILEIRRSGKILIPYQIYLEHQESDILQSMERIIRLHNTPNLGSRIDILSEWFHLMSKLTNIVLQKLDNSNLSCTPTERACVEKAIRYITEHYDRKLSVRQIADHIGISESYLHRTFRKVQKTSVLNFCNQYRIETAISLIRHKDMTLKQAGYQVGIEDPSYMSRLFKKVKGVSCHEFFKEKLSV